MKHATQTLTVLAFLAAVACGGSVPPPPAPAPVPPVPSPDPNPPTTPPGQDLPVWNLTWTVTDADTGRPLAGVAIHAERINPTLGPVRDRTTDGNGFAHMDARQGRWRATLTLQGYLPLTWTFDVLKDEHKPPQLQPRPPPPPPEPEPPALHGRVRADRHAFVDDDGPFLGLGTTCMWCLWGYEHDRGRLEQNLRYLIDHGIGYVRVLGMVGAQPYWQGRVIPPDPAVLEAFAGWAFSLGLRTQVTLFADAQVMMPSNAARQRYVDDVAGVLNRHPERFIVAEAANEFWLNGFSGSTDLAEIRSLTRRLNTQTAVLVAASAPAGPDCETDWAPLYQGGIADVGTFHFDRRRDLVDGAWRPVRQPWEWQFCDQVPSVGANNEPIGPGASVAEDDDPARIVSAAITTYLSGLAAYVYHPSEGIRGYGNYWDTHNGESILEGLAALQDYLPADLPNWTPQNHHWPGHPFSPSLNDQIWPDGARHGVVRAYAATKGTRFIVLLAGIRDHVTLVPRGPVTVRVLRPSPFADLGLRRGDPGHPLTFAQPPGQAFVLIGTFD